MRRTLRPFLDKSLEPGDDWHPKLEEKVKSCEAFVCVIGAQHFGFALCTQ